MTTADQLAIVSKLLQPQEEAHTIAQVSFVIVIFVIALSSIVKAFLHFSCNPEFLLKSDFNELFHNTCIFWKHANLSTTFTFSWPFVVYSDHTTYILNNLLLMRYPASAWAEWQFCTKRAVCTQQYRWLTHARLWLRLLGALLQQSSFIGT